MKRRLKLIGFFTGGVVLLLLLLVLIEHIRGRAALHRYWTQMTAKGEKLSLAELKPKPLPAEENAFVSLVKLSNQLDAAATVLDDAPPSLRFASPGKALVSWKLSEWSDQEATNDWDGIEPRLSQAKNLFESLHSVVEKPAYDSGFNYESGSETR